MTSSTPPPGPRPTGAPEQPAPQSPTPAGSSASPGKSGGPRTWFTGLPDTIRLFVQLWLLLLGLEVIHQVLNVVISLLDTAALKASAREVLSEAQMELLGDGAVNAAATASALIMGLLGVLMMGLLLWMVLLFRKRSDHAAKARRLLLFFGFYFGFRILMIFLLSPGATDVPVALYAVDGSLQILIGVLAVLTVLLSFRQDTLKWTGEIPGDPGAPELPTPPGGRPGGPPEHSAGPARDNRADSPVPKGWHYPGQPPQNPPQDPSQDEQEK